MSDFVSSLRDLMRSPGVKFFLIAFLILLLLIPLLLVMGLISERESRANSVTAEVARTWGGTQNLSGPYLIVPYSVMVETVNNRKDKEKTERKEQRFGVFLPEKVQFDAKTKSDVLRRSIFDVNVYSADLSLTGAFATPDMRAIDANAIDVRWNDAILTVAMSDVSGLRKTATLKLDGKTDLNFEPSVGIAQSRQNGIHARLNPLSAPDANTGPEAIAAPQTAPKAFSFDIDLNFSGSSGLFFAPAGRLTKANLSADWPHPSFTGGFLPVKREISDTGFDAAWQVPHLARSIPQAWTFNRGVLDRFGPHRFGVTYYAPVDFYDLVSRAAKYGILFLALAFMAVFVMELLSRKRIHAVQYIFVGLAMIFFYVLLLSFSEHIGFAPAYLTASAATGTMLAVYFSRAFESTRFGIAAALLFLLIYGLLYMILRLEDYALLAGAVLGFAALTSVMFMTLRVDWSSGTSTSTSDPKSKV